MSITVGIVGLGLMGGSLAKTIVKLTSNRVYGYDIDAAVLAKAEKSGTIHGVLTPNHLAKCNYLFIGLYPQQAVDYIGQNIAFLPKGAVIIDLCGVKRFVCNKVYPIACKHGIHFIGGHPMAGREFSGFDHAISTLFAGSSMLLTPFSDTPKQILEQVKEFFLQLGFGRVVITTPADHDRIIAYTSQLAHVLSSAYIKSPTAQEHDGFSAGSFKDLTRVAKLNEEMWSELFLENGDNLLFEIDTLISHLAEYRESIAKGDRARLKELLRRGRIIKEELV